MKNSILIPVFMVFAFLLVLSAPARAQSAHSAYCAGIDSTAKVLSCLKRHQKSAEKELNEIYGLMTGALEGEDLENLKAIHQNWLSYRDAQCDWETDRTQTGSLKQIHKISCLARMTENRAALLKTAHMEEADPDKQRQFSNFPRWMNALEKDYPDIFWDYSARLRGDLNCDGVDEVILPGLKIAKGTQLEGDDKTHHPASYHVAISTNPPTGRPQAHLLGFTLGQEEVCALPVRLQMTEHKDSEEAPESCTAELVLESPGCDPAQIVLTDQGYGLKTKAAPEKRADVK